MGNYYESFVEDKISEGRFKNASEVIRAGLRLLEVEENRIMALKNAIKEGMNSGIASNFDAKSHLKSIKSAKKQNAKL